MSSTELSTPIEQAGAQQVAASRTLTYELIRLQRLQSAIMCNNAKACYDRIIENLNKLTLLRKGLPVEVAKLHTQTFHTIQFHIKHMLGLGTCSRGNSDTLPVFGVG
jgi:hypothetical protein